MGERSTADRRWLSAPLVAGAVALLALVAWNAVYSIRWASSGVEAAQPVTSPADYLLRLVPVVLALTAWSALTAGVNWFYRRRSDGWGRALRSGAVALALLLPFGLSAAWGLTVQDGWRGLGAISVALVVAAPIAAVVLTGVAHAALRLVSRGMAGGVGVGGEPGERRR